MILFLLTIRKNLKKFFSSFLINDIFYESRLLFFSIHQKKKNHKGIIWQLATVFFYFHFLCQLIFYLFNESLDLITHLSSFLEKKSAYEINLNFKDGILKINER